VTSVTKLFGANLLSGTSRTVVLHLSEPVGAGTPIVLRQPLVRPLHVTLDAAACG